MNAIGTVLKDSHLAKMIMDRTSPDPQLVEPVEEHSIIPHPMAAEEEVTEQMYAPAMVLPEQVNRDRAETKLG